MTRICNIQAIGFQAYFICKIFIAYTFIHRSVAIFLLGFFDFNAFLIHHIKLSECF